MAVNMKDLAALFLKRKSAIFATRNTVTGGAGATTTAATLNTSSGKVTTATATGVAGATHTLTLTNSVIQATDIVLVSVAGGGTGTPAITRVTPADGSVVVVTQNIHASSAFNAALVYSFFVVKTVLE